MDNPETLVTLDTQDTGRRQTNKNEKVMHRESVEFTSNYSKILIVICF
jgi:hypothetical protein